MPAKSKTHLQLADGNWLIQHPDIKWPEGGDPAGLDFEIEGLPKDFLLSPIIFSPDKQIFFHGGDFLPHTHLPMPWASNELWIGQYPDRREVGFIPLFAFIIPDHLYKKLKPRAYFGDNIIDHAKFVMEAKALGAKCFVTPNVHAVYPHAYNPKIGEEKFKHVVTRDLKKFEKEWRMDLDREYRLPIVTQTIVTHPGGYNVHAFNMLKNLFRERIKVYYHFIGGTNEDEKESGCHFIDDFKSQYGSNKLPQITLCHGTNNFKNSGAYKIAYSTTEVSGIPVEWVQCFNDMDEVWATSEFAKKAFVDSGVKVPVLVMPEGVDPDYFHPGIAPFANAPKENFRFFSNFAWGRRKGVDVLFEAFRKEFDKGEDVCLMLKTLPSYWGHKIKDEMKLVYQRKDAAPVYVYDIDIKKYELARIYRQASVFVWPSRGEGFGLPALEAMACGLPIIASNHSSHLEFMLKDGKPRPGSLLLDGKVAPYDKGDSIYYPGFDWFNPSVKHLQKQMRYAFENYKRLKKEALATSEIMRREWSWSTTNKVIVKRLEEVYKKAWKVS